ncbi:MAG: hypothetical protein QOG59_318, partial [Solirubrobacteraceae bacterium]|nr:hypothetical protein [Solirubrobacteraceae bacterium]
MGTLSRPPLASFLGKLRGSVHKAVRSQEAESSSSSGRGFKKLAA